MLLPMYPLLLVLAVVQAGILPKGGGGGGGGYLGTFGGDLSQAVKVIRVTNTVAVPVPVPVPYAKHVPYPVSVPKPIPYAVPQPIPVEVTKPVIIPHAVPLEIPKPYSVPSLPQQLPLSIPSEFLVAPQYHPNQANDYQAYLNYGSGSGSDFPSGGSAYGQTSFTQDHSYTPQIPQGYGSQGSFGYGATDQEGFAASAQGGYPGPTHGGYSMTDGAGYNHGSSGFGTSGSTIGQNFETTNSIDDHPSGHGNY